MIKPLQTTTFTHFLRLRALYETVVVMNLWTLLFLRGLKKDITQFI
jgi:hypothetical protein